ncbi:Inositol phosphosphingolipids phospholipase C [Pleurostoma richardsiae]|uniref:Inositol phosphosphingolipids phospholipase C n=1 Tax=Pleurostoma richardsiae TaxID=41990 RepID=A0AA38RVR0_9PEZI|nr:Inositol phosphosphingolipids phospholipase C [Pleurostoma richardsiae]
MDSLPTEINIITLNCWGLKYLSKQRNERLTQIGRELAAATPAPHIVALQECWTQEDYRAIRREARLVLPYGKFYFSGAFGGGLAILSRWPIEESTMFRYPLNGRPTAFFRGDWFVGKGVACAAIRYGPGEKHVIEVFNTHTHAPYEKEPHDSYTAHRTAQAWEVARLLRGAAARGHLVIGLGDFNMLPDSLPHRLITAHAPVRDAWRVLHPDSALGPADHPAERARGRPVPTAELNLLENGATSDNVYNTWRWPATMRKLLGPGRPAVEVPPERADPRGKRLDYVFAGTGDVRALGGGWVVRDARVGMTKRHPELGCSLSDHFSVEVTLAFHRADEGAGGDGSGAGEKASGGSRRRRSDRGSLDPDGAVREGAFLESPASSIRRRRSLSLDAQLLAAPGGEGLPASTYDEILGMVRRYVAREQRQRRWRGWHFFGEVAVAVGCLVAVWFSPHNYVAFILMLVSSLGLTAGTIDGLISLLFIGSELRALKEFEWEISNAKAAASGGPLPAQQDGEKGW